ncbi:MAG: hypothetical protein QHJ82_12995 [Verrucomicrobiota bacterium]|nr:hypothetical protein [Verrucomicrobiota bacterium]
MKRRTFISVSARAAILGSALVFDKVRAGADPLRAAVIGHTGRFDYGHGLESIFKGRPNTWHPLSPTVLKCVEPRVASPVTDWLEAIAENREPVCSGKSGAWVVEMVMGVYQAALTKQRVPFPLAVRTHPLA